MSEHIIKANRHKQLRSFCMAAKMGGFSKAADLLQLSQPSVSLQIQGLEKELKAELFTRNGPKITLTDAGKKLLELAQPLVEQMDSLPTRFTALHKPEETTEINIAAGEASILYLLPTIIETFKQRYPNVHIRLHNVSGNSGIEAIRDGKVDFAVGPMLEVPADILYKKIYRFVPVLIMPFGHPLAAVEDISLKDIVQYDLILPPKHRNTWRIVDDVLQKHQLSYKTSLEAWSWEIIKKYVELGLGLSIITSVSLTGNEKLIARPLSKYFPDYYYGVTMKRKGTLSLPAKNFIELIDPSFFRGS
ncbi:MAG: LysR family transcriptional regulator [Cycloclasticus sp. symbiont of Bathymodiolus heckerae]|nr:MAG: LysR family transcriptional regulator [Cycloclasticus sp. symbiont of Bathymodiolus heckerae]